MNAGSVRAWPHSIVPSLVARIRITYPLIAFLVAIAGLLAVVPGSSARGVEFTTDTAPLEVAGRSTLATVGYVDLGQRHLYVTGESLLLLAIASGLATRSRFGALIGIGLGVSAAGTLTVVTGCACGTGTATPLWQLAG